MKKTTASPSPCPRPRPLRAAALLVALLAAAGLAAQETPDEPPAPPETSERDSGKPEVAKEPEPVEARLVGPGSRHVRSVRPFRRGAGRVDWSRQGDRIAFDEPDGDGRYVIRLLDVVSGSERCLTCEIYELRKRHALAPAWHPSGEYLIFQVQDLPRRMWLDAARLATPHRGLHADLWMVPADGSRAWQLTRVAENGGAVIEPHFSHEGGRLVWSERVASRHGPWGDWTLRVAEFTIRRGLPRLGKLSAHRPPAPRGFVAAYGFTPDDRGLLVAAVPERGADDGGRDLLRLELEGDRAEPLTDTPGTFEDVPAVGPRSDLVVFVSDRNLPRRRGSPLPYRGDLWFLSQRDGRQERLTFFNDPDSDHYLGEALVDDVAWSPEGDRLLVHVVHVARDSGEVEQGLHMVELDEYFQR